ncbi:MAG: small multi-drug export protein [Candidatus Azambacteria bacterium]|nr:small multi-drug export protein [Candidatus Azambacteria bacterium]
MLDELITFFTAALPLGELRVAIPLAILKFGFNPYKAFVIGVLGNILLVLPLLVGIEKISEYLSHKFYWFNRFFSWLFERTRIKHSGHFAYWGDLALFIFVAIPLPLTGAYSGIVAAFVFGVPLKHAFWSIVLGVLAAGLIVTAVTMLL